MDDQNTNPQGDDMATGATPMPEQDETVPAEGEATPEATQEETPASDEAAA